VAPRRRGHEEGEADAKRAKEWLKNAFALLGAGAKSAKGYGRFTISE
jgi:CRISPR-associated protein Cmr6